METAPVARPYIAIDVGTANTRVAVFRGDEGEIIPAADGSRSMPSYVAFTERGRVIGLSAKRQLAANPENTIFGMMRFIGLRLADMVVQDSLRWYPFKVIERQDQLAVEVDFMGTRKWFTFVEILSMILSKARENAEAYLGFSVADVVLAAPALFTSKQRQSLRDAATMARLRVFNIIPAPGAIPLSLRSLSGTSGEQNCLVLDLGAGTCDATCFIFEEGIIEIKTITSDNFLGGEDFIRRLMKHFMNEIQRKWNYSIQKSSRAMCRLRAACENAMHDLSSSQLVPVHIDAFIEDQDFDSSISRSRFEELCMDLFKTAIGVVDIILMQSKIPAPQVHHIYLSGACSRIPCLQGLLRAHLNGMDLSRSINPEEDHVMGLAIQASIWAGNARGWMNETLLLDVLPISIGVNNQGGLMEKIIARNSTLPTKKSITLAPMDSRLQFYEGERHRVKDNILLKEVDISSIITVAGAEVEITMESDFYRFIDVTIINPISKKSITVCLNRLPLISEDDVSRFASNLYRLEQQERLEAAKSLEREKLDSRIASLSERFNDSENSAVFERLISDLAEVRIWTDENDPDSLEPYQVQQLKLDVIEASHRAMTTQSSDMAFFIQVFETVEQIIKRLHQTEMSLNTFVAARKLVSFLEESKGVESERFRQHRNELVTNLALMVARIPLPRDDEDKAEAVEPDTETDEDTAVDPTLTTDEEFGAWFKTQQESATTGYSHAQLGCIARYLENVGTPAWAQNPRLYTVLRSIGSLQIMDDFLQHDLTDLCFPFTPNTLPASLSADSKSLFLEMQPRVVSKDLLLENGSIRQHVHFKEEPAIFKVVGRLGRGKHAVVDKVMSVVSRREYARKRFKRPKGASQETVKSFIAELNNLKAVDHRHCATIWASYSDPRFLSLITYPAGDCNLEDYYKTIGADRDAWSLVKSFVGCLTNAVQYLHSQQIQHRNIKPRNIIINGDRVFLTDFSVMYTWEGFSGDAIYRNGDPCEYAAREVVYGETSTQSADIWSLGCVFLEMIFVSLGRMEDVKNSFKETSKNTCWFANQEVISSWVRSLNVESPVDRTILDWGMKMLKAEPEYRITAAELSKAIAMKSADQGVQYCGSCCQDDVDSMTDDDEEDNEDFWADESD